MFVVLCVVSLSVASRVLLMCLLVDYYSLFVVVCDRLLCVVVDCV